MEVDTLITNVPPNNLNIHELQKRLNKRFVKGEFTELCSDKVFHKQNWRLNYPNKADNKATFYGAIVKEVCEGRKNMGANN
ncbi:hypothetical protein AMD01_01335 [Priestia koreensis]|uniref:Uncharacterized protein n=1 Tax=Priestia koreensis TaxID=284581 RepID=A0A0M0LI99_9BACI|nr:hypothetical protein AMD01_01335 [Priestia koreensis]